MVAWFRRGIGARDASNRRPGAEVGGACQLVLDELVLKELMLEALVSGDFGGLQQANGLASKAFVLPSL
jgi:hypothetical protein